MRPSFYPPSADSAFYFIARLRRRRPANRTRPNSETCWEINRIYKCMLIIWGAQWPIPQNLGAKTAYFVTVLISTIWNYAIMTKMGQQVASSVNTLHDYGAGGIKWRRIANVNETIDIKPLVSRDQKISVRYVSHLSALSGNTSLIATLSSFSY